MALFPHIYGCLSPQRKRHLYLLLALILLGAIAELATLGSLLPFLSLLAGVQEPASFAWFAHALAAMGVTTPREQIWVAATFFAAAALLAGAIRLALNWSTQRFTALLSCELSNDVQRRILEQPFAYHLSHNSSEAVAAMDNVQALTFNILLQLIYGAAAAMIMLVIIAALVWLDPFTTTIAAAAFLLLYVLFSALIQRRLTRNSEMMRPSYEERVRIVQESLGGIRDIILDGTQQVYLGALWKVNLKYGLASAMNRFIAAAPRFIFEAIGMVVIALVALVIADHDRSFSSALPLLGAIALGAQRLLPLLQQVYHAWASVAGNGSIAAEVVTLLRLPVPPEGALPRTEPLPFHDRISMEGVSFSYRGSRRPVLDGVTLEIPRGSIFGVMGNTGSGKSTLADLLMALIEPTSGKISIDGVTLAGEERRRWQKSIAHVPQSIFLADASIERNIAFGVAPETIDRDQVRKAAAIAQLHEFIESLPDGYDSSIGERGVRLSGGQRQRLGIARAIYKQTPVLILDEATSALDETTEDAVMNALVEWGEEGRTILVIAHRLSTLARSTLLVRLEGGKLAVVRDKADCGELRSSRRSRR